MNILFTIIMTLFGIVSSLASTTVLQTSQAADDTVIKNDVNSMYQKLEEYYNGSTESISVMYPYIAMAHCANASFKSSPHACNLQILNI